MLCYVIMRISDKTWKVRDTKPGIKKIVNGNLGHHHY